MTKIYLIRHAEAEGNLYRRSQGQYDSNVTALGRRQIAALAERFRGETIDALWSSDLYRTQSTAQAVLRYHPELALHTTPRLREIDVGVWEDTPWGNLNEDWPEQMYLFSNDPARWRVPGGELYEDLAARMRAAVLDLAARYEGKTVAAVSHGLAVRSLLCGVEGIPSDEIWRMPYGDNTSVTLLRVENGEIHIEWKNDASHLDAAGLSTFARQGWRKKPAKNAAAPTYGVLHPLDPVKDAALYVRCYENTWLASHGDLQGFSPTIYLRNAQEHVKRDPRCVMRLDFGGRFAGIVTLDPERGADVGAGWISLVWIEPELRGGRLGVQLIGHAVSLFRRMGRKTLRLHVADTNAAALGFYERLGFRRIGTDRGAVGTLHLLEWNITPHVLTQEELFGG